MAETVSKVMNLLPEYQEEFLKDLLANIYQVDEESGTITGIAAQSPLYGQPVYQSRPFHDGVGAGYDFLVIGLVATATDFPHPDGQVRFQKRLAALGQGHARSVLQ